MKKKKKSNRVISGILSIIYYFWVKTLRIRILGYTPRKNVIYTFWHSQVFPLIYTYRNRDVSVLISQHSDADIAGDILGTFNFPVIRGSSTRGGVKSGMKLLKSIKSGESIAITPDGPKGPRWRFKEGIVELSRLSGRPIILVGIGYSKKIRLKTWDRFELPLPFSNCCIILSKPFLGRALLLDRLEEELIEITLQAENIARGKSGRVWESDWA